jgi:hypothetical protein
VPSASDDAIPLGTIRRYHSLSFEEEQNNVDMIGRIDRKTESTTNDFEAEGHPPTTTTVATSQVPPPVVSLKPKIKKY